MLTNCFPTPLPRPVPSLLWASGPDLCFPSWGSRSYRLLSSSWVRTLETLKMCPCPWVPATTTPPRAPGPAEAASCPSAASCERSEPPRPGSGAGRWPVARPSCPGRLAGVELKETEPPGKPTSPLTQFQGDDSRPGPEGQAEGRGRLSLLFPGSRKLFPDSAGGPGPPIRWGMSEFGGWGAPGRRTDTGRQRERERETPPRGRRRAEGKQKRQAPTQRNGKRAEGDKERERGRPGGREGSGNRKTETARWEDRRPDAERRHQRPGEKTAARPRTEPGDARAPAAELRARPGARAARPGPPPAARLPLSAAHRPRSAADLRPSEGKPGRVGGDRLKAAGVVRSHPAPRPRPRRLRAPGASELGGGASARCPRAARRCARGRSLWKPGARAPARRDLPRAAEGSAARRRFLRGCLRAAAGGRGALGSSGRRPAGLAAAPLVSDAGCASASAAPGGRAVRERRASGSDVRVSPLQIGSEGGRRGGRDARKKERAGGAAPSRRAGGGASAAAPRRGPLSPCRPRAPGRGRTPSDGAAELLGRPRGPRARRPPFVPLKHTLPDFSALGLLPPASSRARGHRAAPGLRVTKMEGASFLGSRRCCFARGRGPGFASRAPNPTRCRLRDPAGLSSS